jgi:hypothetical protein
MPSSKGRTIDAVDIYCCISAVSPPSEVQFNGMILAFDVVERKQE